MVNSIEDFIKFIDDKSFKKIFLLCGKNSFKNSGAEKLFIKNIHKKNIKFFYKISKLPNLIELIKIISN